MSAAEIAHALGGACRSGAWHRCICPVHQSNGATLALKDGPRGLIVKCWAGCDPRLVLAELRRLGLLDSDGGGAVCTPDPAEIAQRRAAEERRRQQRIAEALDFWRHETMPVAPGTIVERYWLGRDLALPVPPTIRASRSWLHHPEGGSRPVMVALVEHVAFGPIGIHRTWLAIDGSIKATFREPRRSLGPVKGGAVRLAPAGKLLMVSEGIETGAAVMTATGSPVWAALSTSGMMSLVLPPLPLAATVIILADHDTNGAGERAAHVAATRWFAEGRRVRIALPQTSGTDWADVLAGNGEAQIAEADHAA
jgi:putative DNA primase/helicase